MGLYYSQGNGSGECSPESDMQSTCRGDGSPPTTVESTGTAPPIKPGSESQPSREEEFLDFLSLQSASVVTYFERLYEASLIPTPPPVRTGSTTEVPSQVEASQSAAEAKQDVLNGDAICRGVFTVSGSAAVAAGGERISAALGHGIESFGEDTESSGFEGGPPTDDLSYALIPVGFFFFAVGGAALYGAAGNTCAG